MNSLVGYGLSSESEDEETGEDNRKQSLKNTDDAGEKRPSRNFLLESESPSSESGPEDEEEGEAIAPDRPPSGPSLTSSGPSMTPSGPSLTSSGRPHTHKLPPPPLGGSGSRDALTGSSVFANPFKAQADERLHVLQKHVPLTLQARPAQIGGKRMCVAYRKDGRCRFGIGCKFAHDSDLQSNQTVTSDHAAKDNAAGTQNHDALASSDGDKETDDKGSEQRRKKRTGVHDSLIPPKRALKLYARLSHP